MLKLVIQTATRNWLPTEQIHVKWNSYCSDSLHQKVQLQKHYAFSHPKNKLKVAARDIGSVDVEM